MALRVAAEGGTCTECDAQGGVLPLGARAVECQALCLTPCERAAIADIYGRT